jgi:uncharacterized protein YbaR (Trm112 family)
VAIIACPSCHKAINVPETKLGRWISCPNCKMEFAALSDKPDPEELPDEIVEQHETSGLRPVSAKQFVIPLGLLLLVALVGFAVYAFAAKRSSMKVSTRGQPGAAVSSEAMPPVERHTNADSPFGGIPGLQQGPLDSVMGIGSSIKSFLWWTTVLSILFLLSSVGMLIWMARDSRNRGMESVASWITPVLLTNLLAFLVYLLARPRGQLVNCRHCNNRCLENALNCPHCRRTKPTRKKRPRLDD